MSLAVESPTFQSLKPHGSVAKLTTPYWWETSGRDLARMLQEADYPADAQRQFLLFFRDTICPALGGRPEPNSLRSGVAWDGNPFEYSFELKNTSAETAVRFVVDVSALRPADEARPLSIKPFEHVLDTLSRATPGFDDTWYACMRDYFVLASRSSAEQKEVVRKVGYQMPMILGFDIHRRLPTAAAIPVMAKVYFPPCFIAEAEGISRWEAVRRSIHSLPNIQSHPNVLRSLDMIQDYLDTKPKEYENGPRYLATDFVMTDQARLKIYFRHPTTDFDDIWDYYTLGGRIPGLDEDKDKFRELIALTSSPPDSAAAVAQQGGDQPLYTAVRRKMTALYFSLSTNNPTPAPKLCIYPQNFAQTDEVIANGIDAWLDKYGWDRGGGKSIKKRVENVFTHRRLSDDKGIFTFLGIGRKEDPVKKDLSMQVYVTGELYKNPRI